ncbi:MAG: pyridoxamine 5'-phosphate oxidase family protein [Saprospiraceae bacterium]
MQSLEEIFQNIWKELHKGKSDKKHPFRFGTFVTISEPFPNPRTVVVRKVEQTNAELWLYTDIRTPKIEEIRLNPKVSWHFYHSKQQIQLRIYGVATILHNETITHEIWQNLPDYGKSDYLTQQSPGSLKINNSKPLLSVNNADNFCVVTTKIQKIDWLQLSRNGHQRAKFELEDGNWNNYWLTP